jgi:UDP-glucose 4-epimerase
LRILLTGSTGYIGRAIYELLHREADIVGLDLKPGPFTHYIGNICDPSLISSLLKQTDVVIHTASLHAPHVGHSDDADFHKVNVEGTSTLLENVIKNGIKRFVYTSTTSVYGCSGRNEGKAIWVTEECDPHPQDIYDETKLEAEALCQSASEEGTSVVCLRVSRCFPEPDHLVAFYRLYRGVDVRDVAKGHALAAKADVAGYHCFNISGPTPFAPEDCQELWRDPWRVIERYYPEGEPWFDERQWKKPSRIDRVYAIGKAMTQLGYRPVYDWRHV